MRRSFAVRLVLRAVCLQPVPALQLRSCDDIAERAKKLHFSSIVLDTHDDTTQRFLFQKLSTSASAIRTGHIDIPRMREGGMNAIFFSIWIDGRTMGPPAVQKALDQIDAVHENVTQVFQRSWFLPNGRRGATRARSRQDRGADGRRRRAHDRQ